MLSHATLANTSGPMLATGSLTNVSSAQLVAFQHSYSPFPSAGVATISSPAVDYSECDESDSLSPEEFQAQLNNIAALMEWRNNNIGYAIGVQFGHLIGTRTRTDDGYSPVQRSSYFEEDVVAIDAEEGAEANILQDNGLVVYEATPEPHIKSQSSSAAPESDPLRNTTGSYWHTQIDTVFGYFSKIQQSLSSAVQGVTDTTRRTIGSIYDRVLIKATTPLQLVFGQIKNYEDVKGSVFPKRKAIQFVTGSDAENIFAADGHVNRFNEVSLYQQGYKLYRAPITSSEQICQTLFSKYKGMKFDFISFEGHGSTYYVEFSGKMSDGDPKLTAKNVHKQLHCLPQYMRERTKVAFRACSAGALSKLPYHNMLLEEDLIFSVKDYFQSSIDYLLYGNQDNLATATYRFLSKTNPAIEVVAPGLNTFGSYVHSADPVDVVSPARLNGQYYVNANLVYNNRSVELIDKLRKLSEFDPENSHISFLDDESLKVEWIKKIKPDIHELKAALRLNMRDKRVQDEYLYGQMYLDANAMIIQMMFSYAGQVVLTLSTGLAANYVRKRLMKP